jgi:hypothetical protein
VSTSLPFRVRLSFSEGCHVFEDYTIEDEKLCKIGNRLRTYDPTQHTELPGALAKVQIGDTKALLQFVRTYGDFGYTDSKGNPTRVAGFSIRLFPLGEPLPWIWAHIRTIKFCLELYRHLYEQREAWVIEHTLDTYRTPLGPQDTHMYEIPIAVQGRTDVMRLTRKQQESMHDFAQKIRHEIIERNIEALTYELRRLDGKTPPVLEFAALIEVVYWHLEVMEKENKPVKPCAWCGSLFIVQHGRQQYCLHPTEPGKESPCAANARQTKKRQAQRVSTP